MRCPFFGVGLEKSESSTPVRQKARRTERGTFKNVRTNTPAVEIPPRDCLPGVVFRRINPAMGFFSDRITGQTGLPKSCLSVHARL